MGDKYKALIVTVYNSENCGSFLQAYAMKKILEDQGFDTKFYKRSSIRTSHDFLRVICKTIKQLIKLNIKEAWFTVVRWFNFEKVGNRLNVYNRTTRFYNNFDIIIVGSDTLWNFDASYFRRKINTYTGSIFSGKKIIFYAVSAGNTTSTVFDQALKGRDIDQFSHLMVRDNHTKKIAQKYTNSKINLVCDPTLLLEKDAYNEIAKKIDNPRPYILLYYFGEIPHELQMQITQYASDKNFDIISLLTNRKWCSKSITADPRLMLGYFMNAECILTNTFHGCAFSIIYQRPFAVHDEHKNKVEELLETYKQKHRLFSSFDKVHCMLQLSQKEKDYEIVKALRDKSYELLINLISTQLKQKDVMKNEK